MPARTKADATAWRRGRLDRRAAPPELLFGQMYEDSAIELDSFAAGGRIFCIASAGCTAFDLAKHGHDVTAVDINPAQIEYVRARVRGEGPRIGKADRALDWLRALGWTLGWGGEAVARFCALSDPNDQLEYWRRRLDTRRLRIALRAAFSPLRLRTAYAGPFIAALPPRFDRVIRGRVERGIALHPNRTNPYAASLFLGRPRDSTPAAVHLETTDAAEFLERCPPACFDGFALSNVLDGAAEGYAGRLLASVRRAARPGAVVILRSLGEPSSDDEARLAAADRSLIWGRIRSERAAPPP